MGVNRNADEIRRLLSEYAAGTISDADRRILMTAALEDQDLFNSLAVEQPLADLMTDPESRSELRNALVEQRPRRFAWLRAPWPMTAAATAMIALLAVLVTLYMPQSPLAPETRMDIRKAEAPAPSALPAAQPSFSDKPAGGIAGTSPGGATPDLLGQTDKGKVASIAVGPQEIAKKAEGGAAGGVGSGLAPSKDVRELRAEKAAAPAVTPPPAAGAAVGGVPGGVVGGVVGGIMPPGEAAKAARDVNAVPTAENESMQMRRESRLLQSAAAQALSYSLLRREADGQFQEVPHDTRFTSGDAARLKLQVSASGYLTVAEYSEDGSWRLIFPLDGSFAAHFEAQSILLLPASQAWEFGPTPRDRKLIAVFTNDPHPPVISAGGTINRPEKGTILDIILRTAP